MRNLDFCFKWAFAGNIVFCKLTMKKTAPTNSVPKTKNMNIGNEATLAFQMANSES